MTKSLSITCRRAPVVAPIPGHQPPPFGVRLVCRSIRQAFGFYPALLSNRFPVAEGFDSSLTESSARQAIGRFAGCVQVLGLLMHRASVTKHLLTFYGVSFSEVDRWK